MKEGGGIKHRVVGGMSLPVTVTGEREKRDPEECQCPWRWPKVVGSITERIDKWNT